MVELFDLNVLPPSGLLVTLQIMFAVMDTSFPVVEGQGVCRPAGGLKWFPHVKDVSNAFRYFSNFSNWNYVIKQACC